MGADDLEHGRDAAELAKTLVSATGEVMLLSVEVLQSNPMPDSQADLHAERKRFGLAVAGRRPAGRIRHTTSLDGQGRGRP